MSDWAKPTFEWNSLATGMLDVTPIVPELKLKISDEHERVYVCALGHRQVGLFEVRTHSTDRPGEVESTSGPVCRTCYSRWIGECCRTTEVPTAAEVPR